MASRHLDLFSKHKEINFDNFITVSFSLSHYLECDPTNEADINENSLPVEIMNLNW
jgi:hypothetical protein